MIAVMARKLRVECAGAIRRVLNRGDSREPTANGRGRLQALAGCCTIRAASAAVLVALSSVAGVASQSEVSESKWDRGLPQLELRNVNLRTEVLLNQFPTDSLTKAWRQVSTRLGIRAVMFVSEEQPLPFETEFAMSESRSRTPKRATTRVAPRRCS
jgi:hypothetical protein